MRHSRKQHRPHTLTLAGLALVTSLAPLPLLAQTEAPAAPAPAPAGPTPASMQEPAPAPAPPPPPAPTPEAAAATAAPAATVEASTPPPPAKKEFKPLSANIWGRIGNIVSNGTKLNDISQNAEVDVLFSGDITDHVKWQADFVGTYGPTLSKDMMGNDKLGGDMTGTAAILDLIGKLEFHDLFNVWLGRMLVPSDRSNFAGPWFMAPWNYPGFYVPFAAPVGPRQGPFGRNDGATVWGQVAGGVFKYYLGAFSLHDQTTTPLYSGRINISLLNKEPGFYHSATYYGMDILALGIGGQYQKNGSGMDDYSEFNADLLYEKNLGSAGVIDLEGAFYKFIGDGEAIKHHFYGLVSYLTPMDLGIGKLQPLFRFQGASPKGGGDMWMLIDAQVGYAISQYSARLALGYQRSQFSGVDAMGAATKTKGNAIFLGFQLQK